MTGLSAFFDPKLKKAWCILVQLWELRENTYIFPLWQIMETVEIKWDVSGVRYDRVHENIYPPTKRRSTCAEEWHLILTAGDFRNHFWWVLILNSGKVAMTFSHCWHPRSAAVVTTDIDISHIFVLLLRRVGPIFVLISLLYAIALFCWVASIKFH